MNFIYLSMVLIIYYKCKNLILHLNPGATIPLSASNGELSVSWVLIREAIVSMDRFQQSLVFSWALVGDNDGNLL
jgi:hypothetical protein